MNAVRVKIRLVPCEQVKPNKYSSGRKFVRSRVNVVLGTVKTGYIHRDLYSQKKSDWGLGFERNSGNEIMGGRTVKMRMEFVMQVPTIILIF